MLSLWGPCEDFFFVLAVRRIVCSRLKLRGHPSFLVGVRICENHFSLDGVDELCRLVLSRSAHDVEKHAGRKKNGHISVLSLSFTSLSLFVVGSIPSSFRSVTRNLDPSLLRPTFRRNNKYPELCLPPFFCASLRSSLRYYAPMLTFPSLTVFIRPSHVFSQKSF